MRAFHALKRYFTEQDPVFWVAFTPALILAALLFVRSPLSNYIFDEQEALLANPYVNGKDLGFFDAFRRDFWGLPPDRSIGSYRPIPNLLWRLLWRVSHLPWLPHWLNVVVHALNATLLAGFAFALTRRRDLSWLAGGSFLMSAVLTEAITGVVGLADVLGGLGVILAVVALRLPLAIMPLGVLAASLFGLFSKESVLVLVPLLPWAALLSAPALHPDRPRRVLRALLAGVFAVLALVVYTEIRRRLFPVTLPAELSASLDPSEPLPRRALHAFLRWFSQPRLPNDPINNPLADADFAHRVAGALRVYASGLGQVVFPWTLSGDYSFPEEPVPPRLVFPGSVLGASLLLLPPFFGIGCWARALLVERRAAREVSSQDPELVPYDALVPPAIDDRALRVSKIGPLILLGIGLVWVPIAYFPHSNIPVLLPTVRAERFWYLPVIGAALVIAVALGRLYALVAPRRAVLAACLVGAFFGFQALRARMHALDYIDDLMFWRATRNAAPNSAKAHLNYSVMVGARGRLEERLAANEIALRLAPRWPMAHVYYGDTLCRLHRPDEAWPHYKRGFEMASNDTNLIALGLQCLWDEKALDRHSDELVSVADKQPGTWLAYLGREIVYNGEEHGGVEKKYRPRGYDEGPKKQ